MLHDNFVSSIPKDVQNTVDKSKTGGSAKLRLSSRSVRVGSTKAALNRNVATKVLNPQNGKSKLIYCQQDGGSQLTLISTKLVKELELRSHDFASFRIETMTGENVISADLINFDLQSLISDEVYSLSNVVAHTRWQDDVDTLPHRQDISSYPDFQDIDLLHLPDNESVDLLIGNDNALLITVLEEREGTNNRKPHAVLSKIGWYSCGGVSPLENALIKICRVHA